MRILIDLDDTLVQLMEKTVYFYNNRYNTDIKIEDLAEWELPDRERWMDIWRIPDFYGSLRPFPGALEALEALRDRGHELVIVTAYPTWESARSKIHWVHTWLRIPGIIPSMDNLILTRGKHHVGTCNDILIDDKIENLNRNRANPICFARPWNRDWPSKRFETWSEIVHEIMIRNTPRSYGGCY